MDYVIYSSGIPFNGDTARTQSLGGSESAAYFLARELAAAGHNVKLFTSHSMGGEWDGVAYIPHGEMSEKYPLGRDFHFYAENTPHDVLIIQRHPLAFATPWASKINIWQLHDLALHRTGREFAQGASFVDAVTVVSDFHAAQVRQVYGIQDDVLRVVPNGVDPALYSGADRKSGSFDMLYQSRPERGLEHLVRPGGIMERLHKQGSKARLLVCRYAANVPQMDQYYARIDGWCNALPNVTILGSLNKRELAEVQERASLLCYPTEFEEVSCITAMESMHAGLPMLTSAAGALPETCRDAGAILLPLKDGAADEDAFVIEILKLEDSPRTLASLATAQRKAAAAYTWRAAAARLEEVVDECFTRRQNPTAMLKHYVEHSDIVAARALFAQASVADPGVRPLNAVDEATLQSLDKLFTFVESPQAMREHYAQHTDLPTEDFATEIQRFASSTRCRGILAMLASTRAKSVVEHGCAYGHLTIAMAQAFPNTEFVGIDFVSANIVRARENAALLGVKNVSFILSDGIDGRVFDVVVGAEILEHVVDYHALLTQWRKLAPQLILTTPSGRWEWTEQDQWERRRFHLHHFEKADLQEIFAGHAANMLFAPAGMDAAGGSLGSWLTHVVWSPATEGIGRVDYSRKHRHTAPRQTVSLCMIVRNAEHTIGAALQSVLPYVDEARIAVDPSTTDATEARATDVARRFTTVPVRITTGEEALVSGFAQARNQSMSRACGDWILWMDSDEIFNGGFRLWRYLRPSNHNAYGTPQHHYSVDPPTVLTTDFPCRLFRATRNVKFFGLVHEHPEDAPGKAIDHSFLVSDLSFAHAGYVDEPTRRRRFRRNFPLLMRDIKEYPDRYLNRFLLLRDMAQMAQFSIESAGGAITGEALRFAEDGVGAFAELLNGKDIPTRMVVDSLDYYGTCVSILGGGFDADVKLGVSYPDAPTLSVATSVKGRFKDKATFEAVVARVQREALSRCEEKYR